MPPSLFIGCDHAGLTLKKTIVASLQSAGVSVIDLGVHASDSADYPVQAELVSRSVVAHPDSFGVLVCGSGMGMSMAANKITGIRAALCTTEYAAKMARSHNNANILCLGERIVGAGLALEIVSVFLNTPFESGRHQRRVDLLNNLKP